MESYSLYMKKNFLYFEVLFLEFLNGFLTFVIEFVFITNANLQNRNNAAFNNYVKQ